MTASVDFEDHSLESQGSGKLKDADKDDEDVPYDASHPDTHPSSYVTAPAMPTHEEPSSTYSQYVTARSFDCTLDSIDEDSAVHFFNPPHGAYYDLEFACRSEALADHDGYISAQNSSHSGLLANPKCTYGLSTPRLPIPALMLTLPTPTIPISPVFLNQSPITVPKYLTASSTPAMTPRTPASAHAFGVPSLPRCDCCGFVEFENGTQCAECDKQWLACKVWYQANDGGRRHYLTEPYIKPAESNARTRAILDVLGVPGGSPSALGLGIEFETQTPRKRRFWRISRLLSSVPIPDRLVNEAHSGSVSVNGSSSSSTLLANLLVKTTVGLGRLRTKIAALLGSAESSVSQALEITESSVSHRSSNQLVPSIPDSGSAEDGLGDPVLLPTGVPCTESRFVEHLAGHFGSLVARV